MFSRSFFCLLSLSPSFSLWFSSYISRHFRQTEKSLVIRRVTMKRLAVWWKLDQLPKFFFCGKCFSLFSFLYTCFSGHNWRRNCYSVSRKNNSVSCLLSKMHSVNDLLPFKKWVKELFFRHYFFCVLFTQTCCWSRLAWQSDQHMI